MSDLPPPVLISTKTSSPAIVALKAPRWTPRKPPCPKRAASVAAAAASQRKGARHAGSSFEPTQRPSAAAWSSGSGIKAYCWSGTNSPSLSSSDSKSSTSAGSMSGGGGAAAAAAAAAGAPATAAAAAARARAS